MEICKDTETAIDQKLIGCSRRGAMRFGLTVGVLTVTTMLICIYASAVITMLS